MKKNLISILILALLVVNLVLTTIMMFSVMSTSKKTSALVTQIAGILSIELTDETESEETAVTMAESEVHDIDGQLTIHLAKATADEKDHYCLVDVSLLVNTTHEDYESYGANLTSYDSLIKSIVSEVIGSYTYDDALAKRDEMRSTILQRIQEQFDSTFIYDVVFSDIMFQ